MIFYIFLMLFALTPVRAQPGAVPEPSPDDFKAGSGPKEPADDASAETYADIPTHFSLAPSIAEFGRFADGGSDSNWYIGFDNAWIVRLPPAPSGEFTRAFIGAKIGRAKTRPHKERPWERTTIPGKIYMAIAQKPAFSSERSFFLTETEDIPLESDSKIYMPGTGSSAWFWKEIPLSLISFTSPNYLIIWSPTRTFRDAQHAPILAAADSADGEKDTEPNAWNNHSIQGVPPRQELGTLQVPINLKPALAIKLCPQPGGGVTVNDFKAQPIAGNKLLVEFSVEGKNVESGWIEMSQDELEWRRISRVLRAPPYSFIIDLGALPPRGAYLRGVARDLLAVEGYAKGQFVLGAGTQ